MLRRLHRQRAFRYVCVAVGILLCLSFLLLLPSIRVTADAGVACEGNNLRVNWIGLNPPVTVIVNGSVVVAAGAASGSTVVIGPGSWNVEVLQFGDLVGTYNASCPGGAEATRDPRRIPNGSDAGLNVPYRLPDGGFDLWTYDPRNNVGRLLVSVPCEQQQAAARTLGRQRVGQQAGNVLLFDGHDAFGRSVRAYFVWPNQITVSGFFADGQPHTFSFSACVDARTIDLREPTSTSTFTPTFTRTPIPPSLRIVTATCSVRGLATFVIRNDGGPMPTAVSLLAFVNDRPATPTANRVQLNPNQQVEVRVSVVPGDSVRISVQSDPPLVSSVECPRPTATNTPTFTPIPPSLRIVSASCDQLGTATFVIRNDGGAMPTSVRVLKFRNNQLIDSRQSLNLNASSQTSVSVQVLPGDRAGIGLESAPPIGVSVECPRPTATFTPTPSRPVIRLTASCDNNGVLTITVRNEGASMTGVGAWVVIRNGDNQGGERYTLAAGASLTATRQGIYGNLTVSASDGQGGVTSVSVVCQRPS